MIAHAETRHDVAIVLPDGHDGGHRRHALLLAAGHLEDLVDGERLGIEALRQRVHLQGHPLDFALAVVALQVVEGMGLGPSRLGTQGGGAEYGPVYRAVPAFEVLQHLAVAFHPALQGPQLAAVLGNLAFQSRLLRRVDDVHKEHRHQNACHHGKQHRERDLFQAFLQRHAHFLVRECVGVVLVYELLSGQL